RGGRRSRTKTCSVWALFAFSALSEHCPCARRQTSAGRERGGRSGTVATPSAESGAARPSAAGGVRADSPCDRLSASESTASTNAESASPPAASRAEPPTAALPVPLHG